jgi:DNA polymerase III subunit delta
MKLAARTVESFLEKPDRNCRAALLYGPDSGLVRERRSRLRTAFLGENSDPMAFVELPEAALLADPARLADEMMSVGFLTPKRLIAVHCGGDKAAKTIQEAASCFHDSVFLLVTADELTPRSALRAWFEEEPACAAIACYHDDERDIQNLIRQSFVKAGIAFDQEIPEYLASQL